MRALLAACLVLGGCAVLQPAPKPAAAPLGPGEIVGAAAAAEAIAIGETTKADVRAVLGEATVVDFPSGYEVWVYRERPAPRTELVLLFDPSGIVAKTRVR